MKYQGLSNLLKCNVERGTSANAAKLHQRKELFDTNTYARKKGRSFFYIRVGSMPRFNAIILLVAAVISLVSGMTTEVWVDVMDELTEAMKQHRPLMINNFNTVEMQYLIACAGSYVHYYARDRSAGATLDCSFSIPSLGAALPLK